MRNIPVSNIGNKIYIYKYSTYLKKKWFHCNKFHTCSGYTTPPIIDLIHSK